MHIKNLNLFKIVIRQVLLGSSFRLASRKIYCGREGLSLGYLSGCNEANEFHFVCIATNVSLNNIRDIIKYKWDFSI